MSSTSLASATVTVESDTADLLVLTRANYEKLHASGKLGHNVIEKVRSVYAERRRMNEEMSAAGGEREVKSDDAEEGEGRAAEEEEEGAKEATVEVADSPRDFSLPSPPPPPHL